MSEFELPSHLEAAIQVDWHEPPVDVLERMMHRPEGRPVPPPPANAITQTLLPPDVRGTSSLGAYSGSLQTRTFPGADVSIMVTPPSGDELWGIRGSIWLHAEEKDGILVALTQRDVLGDHVVATAVVHDGGSFRLREALGSDWNLEFHLPNEEVYLLEGSAR